MGDSRGRNAQIQESEDREGMEEKKETPVYNVGSPWPLRLGL